MIVRVDGQAFALPVAQIESAQPLDTVDEVKDASEGSSSSNQSVGFRDRRIPLIDARKLLGIAGTTTQAWPKLLVVRSGNSLIGLAVDSIVGTEDLVIKPLVRCLPGTQ